MALRYALLALFAFVLSAPGYTQEQINRFDVDISVQTDGDIEVKETIEVTASGMRIKRGIFRDLPRYYMAGDERLPNGYSVREVRRNGKSEPYEILKDGNAYRIRIGDADRYLQQGVHTYEIIYGVKNQVRYFSNHDEIYWNVTGNYWAFRIENARTEITLPAGASITQTHGYSGALGDTGNDFTYSRNENVHVFEATRPLQSGEGLTVSLGFEKGLIDPPSSADKTRLWWQRYGALAILFGSFLGLCWYYLRVFDKVGRDPPRQPVFPRYEPPEGYSPAAAHHIYHRYTSGHKALIATLMSLAVKGRIKIDAPSKKETTLTRSAGTNLPPDISAEDRELEAAIFDRSPYVTLGDKYNSSFTDAYNEFKSQLGKAYGRDYFRWNFLYVAFAAALSAGAIFFAVTQAPNWSHWHTAGILSLAGLNGLFMYLMPAPTKKGQAVRAEIQGFKLYMETAEKLQLNAAEVGSNAPPPMTVERYEKYLPYAVALGVEEPWTQHFESLIPEEASAYNPAWTNMSRSSFGNLTKLSDSLISNMSSGVSGALPQSSSSSGSGGFSGGGGGGGGGGGW